jgi:hypothetical protein
MSHISAVNDRQNSGVGVRKNQIDLATIRRCSIDSTTRCDDIMKMAIHITAVD